MNRFLAFAVLTALLAPASSGAVLADSSEQKQAREAVKRGDIRPLSDAIAKVEKEYEGHMLDAKMEHEYGRYVYEIKLITKNGWRRKLYLDAKTLELVKEKMKPPHDSGEKDKDKDKD
ncbi:MAG: PepSY domain-containing protein [Alphaproteobacteria bacterium]|nr:PepSY domain-containing protein [Alphaproteobacteria bacterium]